MGGCHPLPWNASSGGSGLSAWLLGRLCSRGAPWEALRDDMACEQRDGPRDTALADRQPGTLLGGDASASASATWAGGEPPGGALPGLLANRVMSQIRGVLGGGRA